MSKNTTESDLGNIRAAIDQKKLNDYLVKSDKNSFTAPFTYKQFGFGQSNPSYQITDGEGRKYVLRKQPPGALLSKTAHRVDREYYMIKALYATGKIPVPRVLLLCQDHSIIGSDFYIMEFVQGRIFHNPALPDLDPKDREECWRSAISTLANLHSIDPTKINLNPMFLKGKLGSHYERQLKTLAVVSNAQAEAVNEKTGKKLGPIPHFEEMVIWMSQNLPRLERPSIVHGDYKMDNLIFHSTENRVIAILDWELCTIGHPLADLGNLLQPLSIELNDKTRPLSGQAIGPLKGASDRYPGLPKSEDALRWYKEITGWDFFFDWPFAVVYAFFRLAVIAHGIAARLYRGQATSPVAGRMAQSVPLLGYLGYAEIIKSSVHSKL